MFKIGNYFFDRKNYRLAVAFWRFALLFKKDPDIMNNIGAVYDSYLPNSLLAKKWYWASIKSGSFVAFSNLASHFIKENDLGNAKRILQKGVDLGDIDCKIELVELLLQENKESKTAKDILLSISEDDYKDSGYLKESIENFLEHFNIKFQSE